ncbi:MAG TPA: histone deacetylase [Armatimonadota bacterium]|nr:histone deacetylase [Armatimonadota bacterium]
MNATGFLYDPICLKHDTGPGHVERPARLLAILARLQETELWSEMEKIRPVPATRSQLELAHSREYIDQAERDIRSGEPVLSTDPALSTIPEFSPDLDPALASWIRARHMQAMTRISPDSLAAALAASGAAVTAVDAVMDGHIQNAFCCVRPPGHHATRDAGMGFCIFNNVAIAARHARVRWGIDRVLIMDWDVHHGNGTQDIFEADPSVFFVSSHESGIYPGTGHSEETGRGEARGTVLNIPFPAHTSEDAFIRSWISRLLPAMERFQPGFVFISAGFDSHRDDLMGSLEMTAAGFGRMTQLALDIAERHAGGRLVSVLEGGYDLDALAESVEAHVRALVEGG